MCTCLFNTYLTIRRNVRQVECCVFKGRDNSWNRGSVSLLSAGHKPNPIKTGPCTFAQLSTSLLILPDLICTEHTMTQFIPPIKPLPSWFFQLFLYETLSWLSWAHANSGNLIIYSQYVSSIFVKV